MEVIASLSGKSYQMSLEDTVILQGKLSNCQDHWRFVFSNNLTTAAKKAGIINAPGENNHVSYPCFYWYTIVKRPLTWAGIFDIFEGWSWSQTDNAL